MKLYVASIFYARSRLAWCCRARVRKRATTDQEGNNHGPPQRAYEAAVGIRVRACSFLEPGWSKTMAKEELRWQNIDADDFTYLLTAVKKSFDECGGNSCYEVARAISHARTVCGLSADISLRDQHGSGGDCIRNLIRSRNAGQIALESGSHLS